MPNPTPDREEAGAMPPSGEAPGAVRLPPHPAEGSRKTPDRPCLNCGDPTVGNYCPTCGQRKVEVRVSLRQMVLEVLDDQLSISSALPRTVGALLFRPGHLTREYAAGRIARYVPPFRLYLVCSILFFLVLSLLPEVRNPATASGDGAAFSLYRPPAGDGSGGGVRASVASRPRATVFVTNDSGAPVPAGPGWLDNVTVKTPSARLDSILQARVDHFNRMSPAEAASQVMGELLELMPTLMFFLLPLFALVLKVLYARQRRFYVEHFVFALHLYAFAFLLYTVALLTRVDAVAVVLGSWVMVYGFLAMKRVYGQGWTRTGFKYLALVAAQQLLMTTFGLLAIAASLFLA